MSHDDVVVAAFAVANQWRIDAVTEGEYGGRKWTISFCDDGVWGGEEELDELWLTDAEAIDKAKERANE